ncbi:unnamed protein product, partial [Sphacelaria rigidula]
FVIYSCITRDAVLSTHLTVKVAFHWRYIPPIPLWRVVARLNFTFHSKRLSPCMGVVPIFPAFGPLHLPSSLGQTHHR